MFEIHIDKILKEFPNIASMLRELKIDHVTFHSIRKNKSGSFNPLKGEKTYQAFQVLEKRGYASRKPFNKEGEVA